MSRRLRSTLTKAIHTPWHRRAPRPSPPSIWQPVIAVGFQRSMTSRPSRNQPVPAPSALDTYCADCGRVMPASNDSPTPRKYCSASCRTRAKDKSRPPIRSAIIHAFHQLLEGSYVVPPGAASGACATTDTASSPVRAKAKGLETERARQKAKAAAKGGAIVLCSEAERTAVALAVDASDSGPEATSDADSNDRSSAEQVYPQKRSLSLSDAAQALREASDLREEARRAARRLVNFGWRSQGLDEDRSVEAVQGGKVVESSYAKGEWGIRWAERF